MERTNSAVPLAAPAAVLTITAAQYWDIVADLDRGQPPTLTMAQWIAFDKSTHKLLNKLISGDFGRYLFSSAVAARSRLDITYFVLTIAESIIRQGEDFYGAVSKCVLDADFRDQAAAIKILILQYADDVPNTYALSQSGNHYYCLSQKDSDRAYMKFYADEPELQMFTRISNRSLMLWPAKNVLLFNGITHCATDFADTYQGGDNFINVSDLDSIKIQLEIHDIKKQICESGEHRLSLNDYFIDIDGQITIDDMRERALEAGQGFGLDGSYHLFDFRVDFVAGMVSCISFIASNSEARLSGGLKQASQRAG